MYVYIVILYRYRYQYMLQIFLTVHFNKTAHNQLFVINTRIMRIQLPVLSSVIRFLYSFAPEWLKFIIT